MSDNQNDIVDKRAALYGDAVDVNIRISKVWSGILGHEVQPVDVPLMMAGLKLVRAQVTPDYSDSSDDVHGWTSIFQTMVGEDMVHARTPDEYWSAIEEGKKSTALVAVTTPPTCTHCGEPEPLHNPFDRACVRQGYDGYYFEDK